MYTDQLSAGYFHMIVANRPMLDVRSPAEFSAGSVPGAVNIGLFTDDEHHKVGLAYRERGKEYAFRLADDLFDEAKVDHLTDLWCAYLDENPAALVYCARGGMRSETAARWIFEKCGRQVERIEGGYKAMRNYLLGWLVPEPIESKPILVGGRTGSGKTALLQSFENSIDLEAIANHRGSTFGRFTTPQPGQADFENRLAVALIRHAGRNHSHLILEDEGRHVGKRFLPKELAAFFKRGDLVVLEVDFEERVDNIYREYVLDSQSLYECREPGADTSPIRLWSEEMNTNLDRIARRLGATMLEQIRALLESGCCHQERNGDPQAHKHWIRLLLRHYYDPMYDYQLKKKDRAPVLSGRKDDVEQYLRSLTS
ncbi:MAG: tRNA 2-selenouridine(34) synthase MnmH [Desulfofustis sp.]